MYSQPPNISTRISHLTKSSTHKMQPTSLAFLHSKRSTVSARPLNNFTNKKLNVRVCRCSHRQCFQNVSKTCHERQQQADWVTRRKYWHDRYLSCHPAGQYEYEEDYEPQAPTHGKKKMAKTVFFHPFRPLVATPSTVLPSKNILFTDFTHQPTLFSRKNTPS